jgi:LuxR family maltose regulon positive regulatory protein
LGEQDEQVQSFLTRTSVLDGLCGPLCDALTGRADGGRVLDRLERENLFVVPLDDERVWYRYHRLFADFLRSRLEHERPGLSATLHRKASEWCEENALIVEAVDHALRACDYERAARLMERGMDQTWYRGEVVTLLGWLRTLPDEAMRQRPLLVVWYAAVLMLVGRLEEAEPLLADAESIVRGPGSKAGKEPNPGADDPKHILATAAAVRSLHARFTGNPTGAVEHARRALSLLPEDNLNPRPFAALCLAEAYRAADDLEAAVAAFAEAARLGRAAGHDYIALAAMGTLSHLRIALGRLREADAALRQALAFAVERGAEQMPAVGRVRIGLGEVLYERDELEASERELVLGTELAERAGEFEVLVRGRVALSRVRRARADAQGALELADEAEALARDSNAPAAIFEATLWRARLGLMVDAARLEGSDPGFAPRTCRVNRSAREAGLLYRARRLVAKGDNDGALRLLDRPDEASGGAGGLLGGNELEALLLRASAHRARGEEARAVDLAGRALVLGEPEGYVRTFVDEGPTITDLLSGLLANRQRGGSSPAEVVPPHYIRKLLAVLERETTGGDPPAEGPIEPLSGRELEVLQLVAAGKTNRQVAAELFVSVGTVKTHANNVYRKLDVHSRTQAVARARELALL